MKTAPKMFFPGERKSLVDMAVAMMPEEVTDSFSNPAVVQQAEGVIADANSRIRSFQNILATKDEANRPAVEAYATQGYDYRSQARRAEMEALVASWPGFPAKERDRIINEAVAECDLNYEGQLAFAMQRIEAVGVDLLKDVDYAVADWSVNEAWRKDQLSGSVQSLSAEQMQDLWLLVLAENLRAELTSRGYGQLMQQTDASTDGDGLRTALIVMHNHLVDYRVDETVKAEIRRRAARYGVIV